MEGDKILKPIIVEPIYERVKSIRVCSIEKGYKVSLWSDKDPNKKILENEADHGAITLELGERELTVGEKLTAKVKIGRTGEEYQFASASAEVYKIPSPLPMPLHPDPLYAGSECIYVWNVIPSSTVRAWNGTELLAESESIDTFLLLLLKRPLDESDTITIEVEIGGNSRSTNPTKLVKPTGSGKYSEEIPAPRILKPLMECQRSVGLTNLITGSKFQILVNREEVRKFCSAERSMLVSISKKLEENQSVTVKQEILGLAAESETEKVEKRTKTYPLSINEPVYEGQEIIYLYGVEDFATLEIYLDEKRVAKVDYEDFNAFNIGKLEYGQIIKVRQTMCDIPSDWTETTVQRKPREMSIDPPKIKTPLYNCVESVEIEEKRPGAIVTVFADGTFIGKGGSDFIDVFPDLTQNQSITAIQTVGDLESGFSDPVIVEGTPDIQTPKIKEPVEACDTIVEVSNVLPGAKVSLFLNKLCIGSGIATHTSIMIPLGFKVGAGAQIHANQSLCTQKSGDHTTKVIDYITLDKLPGVKFPNMSFKCKVITKCPVTTDTKINIISVTTSNNDPYYDPSVISIQGSEFIIPKGLSSTEFNIKTNKPGLTLIKISSDGYIQVTGVIDDVQGWGKNGYHKDLEYYYVRGYEPVVNIEKELTEGTSLFVDFSLNPAPWKDWKVKIDSYAFAADYPSYNLSISPKELTIPAGQKSDTFKIDIPKLKSSDKLGTYLVAIDAPYYLFKTVSGYIKKAPATQTPDKPKNPTTISYPISLDHTIAGQYEHGKPDYGVTPGEIKRIENHSKYKLKIFKWVGFNAPQGEPGFNYVLKTGEGVDVQIKTKDVLNGWGAYILESNEKPNEHDPFIGLIIKYTTK